jgi:hypothetical protein
MAKDLTVDTLQDTILDLERRVEKLLLRQASEPRQRILGALVTELKLHGVQDVVVIPMVYCNRRT